MEKQAPERTEGTGATRRLGYDEQCVVCQNEGPHDLDDRQHVKEGSE